jgi:hypothetical protein
MARLVITIEIPEDFEGIQRTEDEIIKEACEILLAAEHEGGLPNRSKLTLLRDNDRSGANLLLDKVEGRFGTHYQNRKANLSEVLK